MASENDNELTPRQEFEFSVTSRDKGKVNLKMMDRITVDDVFLHLVHQEIFSIRTGVNPDDEINSLFKDFLLKERFITGQN